jgi:hypothetical protein
MGLSRSARRLPKIAHGACLSAPIVMWTLVPIFTLHTPYSVLRTQYNTNVYTRAAPHFSSLREASLIFLSQRQPHTHTVCMIAKTLPYVCTGRSITNVVDLNHRLIKTVTMNTYVDYG